MPKSKSTTAGAVGPARPAASAREDVRDQAWVVGEDVKELGKLTKEAAKEAVEDGKRKVADYYERGRDEAHDLQQKLEDYVREHPWKSLLYAGGAGLLLSVLLRRS